MAFQFWSHQLAVLRVRYNGGRHVHMPHLLSSAASFSNIMSGDPSNCYHNELCNSDKVKHRHPADEKNILNELSELLPISWPNAVSNVCNDDYVKNEMGSREHHGFLSPEEKFRGIFLQKLRSKTALEYALTNVPADLNIDIVARVPTISADTHSYNVILKALGRRKYFGFMEEMMHEMKSNGTTATLETLSIVMDSFVRAHRVNKAIELFGKLEEFGLERDTESLNVLLQTLCQRSHVGAANSLFKSVVGKVPFDMTTYNTIIGGWSRMGRVGDIEKNLEAMAADGFAPNCSTFGHLIQGLGRAGQIDDAVHIFDGLKEKGYDLDLSVYNAMIYNFAIIGDFDACIQYYRSMLSERCNPNMDTYKSLINSFLKFRKVADALEMFDEMLSRGLVPTTGMVTSFIEPLCGYGPPYAALMIYKKARKAGCMVSLRAYKLLLMRLSRFGKCGMLLTMWDEMQEAGHLLDVEVYEYIVNGLCNIGQLENAVLVMEECLRKGFCPSRRIYSKLNTKLLVSNNVEKAYKLFLKIKHARLHDNASRYWRAKGWHF
ncbi:uncharacterized protein J3R85_010675 [Psidium guajava]|nr:uncharacterized protein J3R85_010675 [Psidium guajava]